jgi:glutathione S-transferase
LFSPCHTYQYNNRYDTGLKKPNKRIETLNALLQGKKFIVGDKFTVADVAISSYLLYVLQFFPGTDLSRWPHLVTYLQACVTRPAYGQAFGEQTQVFLEQSLADMGKKQTRGIFDIYQS